MGETDRLGSLWAAALHTAQAPNARHIDAPLLQQAGALRGLPGRQARRLVWRASCCASAPKLCAEPWLSPRRQVQCCASPLSVLLGETFRLIPSDWFRKYQPWPIQAAEAVKRLSRGVWHAARNRVRLAQHGCEAWLPNFGLWLCQLAHCHRPLFCTLVPPIRGLPPIRGHSTRAQQQQRQTRFRPLAGPTDTP